MQTYQLGVDLAKRLAAITPEFGSFHRGFAMAPGESVPVLDLHGSKDTTVPANVSLSADGYYYTTTDEIFNGGAYSTGWKAANGCDGPGYHWKTQWDGRDDFWCFAECQAGDVVRCMWNGGHNWLFNNAKANGGLVTQFLLQWSKPSHAGFGRTHGEPPSAGRPLSNVRILGTHDPSPNVTAAFAALPRTLRAVPVRPEPAGEAVEEVEVTSHYTNPRIGGCMADEQEVAVGTGTVCAPKIAARLDSNSTRSVSGAQLEPPVPHCRLGGAAPHENGCPTDAPVAPWSKAWPICLAKSADGDPDPYMKGDFHCLLVCPCVDDHAAECGLAAHAHCPLGARCERGELRNRAHGVCTYHKHHP